jgi:hypothetical protein
LAAGVYERRSREYAPPVPVVGAELIDQHRVVAGLEHPAEEGVVAAGDVVVAGDLARRIGAHAADREHRVEGRVDRELHARAGGDAERIDVLGAAGLSAHRREPTGARGGPHRAVGGEREGALERDAAARHRRVDGHDRDIVGGDGRVGRSHDVIGVDGLVRRRHDVFDRRVGSAAHVLVAGVGEHLAGVDLRRIDDGSIEGRRVDRAHVDRGRIE